MSVLTFNVKIMCDRCKGAYQSSTIEEEKAEEQAYLEGWVKLRAWNRKQQMPLRSWHLCPNCWKTVEEEVGTPLQLNEEIGVD